MAITKLPSFTLDPWITDKSNSAADYANAAFASANNATDSWVRDAANSASSYANSAFVTANNAVDTWVRDAANSGSSYANSSFTLANTNSTTITIVGDYANSAFSVANGKATTSYVDTAIANLVDSAPTTLDTLNELAAALGDDPNFATTLSTTIGVVGGYANSAFGAANNATDSWVRDAANSGSSYANSAFITANGAQTHAEAAYTAANSSTGVTYTIDTSPPASGNTVGDIWIDSDDGILYTWLDDGDSYQWIELGPTPGGVSSSGGGAGFSAGNTYTYAILFGG